MLLFTILSKLNYIYLYFNLLCLIFSLSLLYNPLHGMLSILCIYFLFQYSGLTQKGSSIRSIQPIQQSRTVLIRKNSENLYIIDQNNQVKFFFKKPLSVHFLNAIELFHGKNKRDIYIVMMCNIGTIIEKVAKNQ